MIDNSKAVGVLVSAFGVFLLAHPLYLSLPPFTTLALDGLPRFYYTTTGLVYLYVALMAFWIDARGDVDFRRVFPASLFGIPVVLGALVLDAGIDRTDLRLIVWDGSVTLFFYPMMLGFVIGSAEDSAKHTAVITGATTVAFASGTLMMVAIGRGPLTGFAVVIGIANLIGIALVDGVFGYPLYRLGLSVAGETT